MLLNESAFDSDSMCETSEFSRVWFGIYSRLKIFAKFFGGGYNGFSVIAGVSLRLESPGFFKRKPVQNCPLVQNFKVLAALVWEIFANKCFPPFLGADPRGLEL